SNNNDFFIKGAKRCFVKISRLVEFLIEILYELESGQLICNMYRYIVEYSGFIERENHGDSKSQNAGESCYDLCGYCALRFGRDVLTEKKSQRGS
ncbi:hypothetical protein V1478_003509, partial [Vespula squamosa]